MGLMPVYKQTEVGAVPEDWDIRRLPEVCQFRSGKAHEQHISDRGRFVCINSKFISTDGRVRKYSAANFSPARKDDVLMVMSDLPNGRALAKAYLVEQDDLYAVNQRVCALTAYRDCPKYLYYVLNRNPYFLRFDDGVNQTHLLNHVFFKCVVPVPPTYREQEAIAGALSDVDALLRVEEATLAKKRDIKQAAVQQLFTGRTRLPGFQAEWVVKRLGDIAQVSVGRTPSRLNPAFWGPGYKWLSIADLKAKVVSDSAEEITALAASQMEVVPAGSLLMSFKLTVGRISFAGCDLFTNEAICAFRAPQAEPAFLYYALGRTNFSLYGKQAVKGHTLNKESLQLIEIRLPERSEQIAIAELLSDMDADIEALEARRDKTRALKQAMTQELLTGRTRLV